MRLEIDTTVSAHPRADETVASGSVVDSTEVKSTLNHGIKAAQAGNRAQARTSLLRATELDPRNENAWLWLASISEYPEELLGFLNHVLEINPENQRAKEWKVATHALLSKTFVQRGIDAAQESQKDFAAECFQTALEYDDRNAVAWMWMASLSESPSVKVSLLEKALEVEPGNEAATSALETAKADILKARLGEAKSAAVAGNNIEAINILDSLLAVKPDSVEAWTMKSHLSEGFDEKIRCFESILALEPDNVAAKAGRDSLLAIFGTVDAANSEDMGTSLGSEASAALDTENANEATTHTSPSEDLELQDDGWNAPAEVKFENTPEEEYENEEPEIVAEPFATYAEETSVPDAAATIDAEQSPVEAELNDLHFGPMVEELPEAEAAYADPQTETVAFTYDVSPDPLPSDSYETGYNSSPAIAMPAEALPLENRSTEPAGELRVQTDEVLSVKAESIVCPFCGETNDPQVISCLSCMAVLTLSDLELLLGNHNPDKLRLREAVERMERQRRSRPLDSNELVTLGLGHLNLRNLQMGYSCLLEASQLNPNNVVLTAQVNSLLIRLEEIKKQEEVQLRMPKGKSILVVDDSPTVRKLIAGKLEKCGHEVICANDGVEAMERLEHFVPDLILLDITMPRMDGYQVCKQIRSNSSTKDVTVVMISGKDGFFDKVRGRMAGTTGYITKPFGPETLMKAVEMYLSGEAPGLDEA